MNFITEAWNLMTSSLVPWLMIIVAVQLVMLLKGGIAAYHHQANSQEATRHLYWMTVVTCVSLAVLAGVFVANHLNPIFGFVTWLCLVLAFIGQGLKEAQNDPPEFFVVTIFGSPTNMIKRAGWRFFPLKGLVFDGIAVNAGWVNEDLDTESGLPGVNYLTADDIEGGAMISFSYVVTTPVKGKLVKDPNGMDVIPARNFIAVGKEDGIRDILDDKVISAFIRFMRTVPKWNDAVTLDNGAIAELVKAIADGDGLDRIPSSVPTDTLMRYYGIIKGGYTDKETKAFEAEAPGVPIEEAIRSKIDGDKTGDEAENARQLIEARREGGDHVPADYEEFLKLMLKEREKVLSDLKSGRARIPIDSLGITLLKVNIGERSFDPEVLEAHSLKTRELAERESERVQTQARNEQADAIYGDGKDFGGSRKDARELALIEAGKMVGTRETKVFEVKITADDDVKDLAKDVAPVVSAFLAAKSAGSGEKPKRSRTKGGKTS